MNQKILMKMGFKPTAHNEIFLDHLETITDFLIEKCPIPEKKALLMLRGSTGISMRYVKEHVDSLLAWGIIRKHTGNYEWVLEGCQEKKIPIEENKIIIEGMKNEDVPDTFPGDIGEYKPCRYRDEQNICSYIPEKPFKPDIKKCAKCSSRKEYEKTNTNTT